jgi:hypothetical protein
MAPTNDKRRYVAKRSTPPASTKGSTPSGKRQAVSPKGSNVSPAAAALAKKQAKAVQVVIPFGVVDKYQVGLKILLDESIYPNAAAVSCLMVDCCLTNEHSFQFLTLF